MMEHDISLLDIMDDGIFDSTLVETIDMFLVDKYASKISYFVSNTAS